MTITDMDDGTLHVTIGEDDEDEDDEQDEDEDDDASAERILDLLRSTYSPQSASWAQWLTCRASRC